MTELVLLGKESGSHSGAQYLLCKDKSIESSQFVYPLLVSASLGGLYVRESSHDLCNYLFLNLIS